MNFYLCFAKYGFDHFQFNVHVKYFCYFVNSDIINFVDFYDNDFEFRFSDFFSYFHIIDVDNDINNNVIYNNFLSAIRDFNLNIDLILVNGLEGENYVRK